MGRCYREWPLMTMFRANAWVTHERLDDEVIVINLETGAYFALEGVAADCWSLLVAGIDLDLAARTLAEHYSIDAVTARRDLDVLSAGLEHEGLLEPATEPGLAVSDVHLPVVAPDRRYKAPVLEKYDDLEELLLLDPVHEVDAAGWPVVRTD